MTHQVLRSHGFLLAALCLGLLWLGGCVSTEEANQRRASAQEARRDRARAASLVTLDLQPARDDVGTIQLFANQDPVEPPLLTRRSGQQLTLTFDLLASGGRPFSVYFYHADRNWERRLAPAQYLSGFTRDDVLDYQISRGTDVPYVHYTYTFPNETIDFVLSGNYVLRVTEQGDETAVLFEVPFFVADQATGLSFATEPVMVPGSAYPFQQPVAVFQPPTALEGDVFNFTTCFVQNARYEQARCTERPLVTQQPRLRFFLQPEVAFEPQPADFFLDLSQLRPGGDLMATDLSASPMTAELEPDFARLGADLGTPRLNRQTVTQGALNGGEPQLAGEYVMTRFGYVPPDERPYRGDVFLLGSFNQWRYDPAYRMDWNAEEGRYELDVLLKQGLYEYQYATPEDTDTALRGPLPRRNDLYTALVYYRDLQFNTDRLISVQQVVQ